MNCRLLTEYCRNGWPEKSSIKELLKLYLPVALELTVVNGLLMRGNRTVIPSSMLGKLQDILALFVTVREQDSQCGGQDWLSCYKSV